MLADSPVTTILLVRDAPAAVEFYRDRLGLAYEGANQEGQELFALGSGHGIALMPDAGAEPSGRTELSFEVGDIAAEVRELEQRGVAFTDYDLPDLKTVDHVCVLGADKAAWFTDPSGNVLCIHQPG